MDRGVPPRVTYWTGTWDPEKEAISKEVQLLRSLGGRQDPVISFSSGQTSGLDVGNRVLRLSAGQWPLLRAIAPIAERCGDISHVFGGLRSWHLLRAVGRRPTVLTMTLPGLPVDPDVARHVDVFVVESEGLERLLRRAGVPAEKIRLIYPGVNLHGFRPRPSGPAHPFRILFASWPSDPHEFEARGISLLVEAARLCPEIEIVLLWRKWGDQVASHRLFDALRPPQNVRIAYLDGRDMSAVYRESHVVASLYAEDFGKSCPNSIIEGLACGTPALVSDSCGIARLIADSGAGLAVPRSPAAVADAARALRNQFAAYSKGARRLAEQAFDVADFLMAYQQLYADIRAVRSRVPVDSQLKVIPGQPSTSWRSLK